MDGVEVNPFSRVYQNVLIHQSSGKIPHEDLRLKWKVGWGKLLEIKYMIVLIDIYIDTRLVDI